VSPFSRHNHAKTAHIHHRRSLMNSVESRANLRSSPLRSPRARKRNRRPSRKRRRTNPVNRSRACSLPRHRQSQLQRKARRRRVKEGYRAVAR
jgi:hypothetical protein